MRSARANWLVVSLSFEKTPLLAKARLGSNKSPDLVARDAEGKVNTVRYEAVNAMLLNEFLKEHRTVQEQSRKIQEQETTIAQLESGMKALASTVNEQASQLQKVSAQLQINNAAAQMIAGNH